MWAWLVSAMSFVAVAAVVVGLVVFTGQDAGTPPQTTDPALAVDLGFDGSVGLVGAPIVSMVEGSGWSPLGAEENEQVRSDSWESSDHECMAVASVSDDVPDVGGSDDRSMSEDAIERLMGERVTELDVDVVEFATTAGGSVSFLAFELPVSGGSSWFAVRAFADSDHIVLVQLACADGNPKQQTVDSVLDDMRFEIEPSA